MKAKKTQNDNWLDDARRPQKEAFAEWLEQARKAAGFTSQEEPAKLAGIVRATWNQYAAARDLPKRSTIIKIAEVLNSPPEIPLRLAGYAPEVAVTKSPALQQLEAASAPLDDASLILLTEIAWSLKRWQDTVIGVTKEEEQKVPKRKAAGHR